MSRSLCRWNQITIAWLATFCGLLLSAHVRAQTDVLERGTTGSTFRDCAECPEMVTLPAGQALIGSPPTELGREADEGPRYLLKITRPFAVGRFEVTFDEWEACVKAQVCRATPEGRDWGRGRRPVMYISWYDAQAYVLWLRQRTGKSYRLLSEAEWEYAARAGHSSVFVSGACLKTSQANFNGSAARYRYCAEDRGHYHAQTVPVGRFSPNAFGLHDMAGNLREWVQDCWAASYQFAPDHGEARKDGDCSYQVIRGGAWADEISAQRTALRGYHDSAGWTPLIGLRVARDL